jgi:hypothetical protein
LPVGSSLADGNFRYERCSKIDKGLLRAYVCKITGLSRTQFTCLIAQYLRDGRIENRRKAPAKPFATRYTPDDIRLLAVTDVLHSTLSGSVLLGLCERMLKV